MSKISQYIKFSNEVKNALQNNLPIVALESTIISHGMPYPNNYQTAIRLEKIVRENKAVPATIAIINGYIHIGLEEHEIEYLSKPENKSEIKKVSRKDLPAILGLKFSGATTVAATMMIANLVGIRVFATGGIGGVHRDAQITMDISADLLELSNTNVTVVCSGVKSILDIGLTLEYLETHGVPIYGYQTEKFPAFYLRDSGFKVDYVIENALEFKKIIEAKTALKLKGGQIVANPVPVEFEINPEKINNAINIALNDAKMANITGKQVTPFLLSKISNITSGDSLLTNIELVCNNAYVASLLAVELKKN